MLRPATFRPLARAMRPAAVAARANSNLASTTPAAPPHPHHDPAARPPPPPPGVPVDPQLHGYPQLPEVSMQTREPWGWWDMQERRNYDEVMQEEEDRLSMWGPDIHKISPGVSLVALLTALGVVAAGTYFVTANRPLRPAVPRSYPYNGLEKELGGYPARTEEVAIEEAEEQIGA